MSSIYYFDTSAFNALFKDNDKEAILIAIKKAGTIYLSAFNFIEISSTKNAKKRIKLLEFFKQLSENRRPLDFQAAILKQSLEAFLNGKNQINISIGNMQDGIWQAIQDPNLLKNKAFKETLQRKAKEENWLNEPHKRAREKFQQIDEISVKPRTSVQFLKHLYANKRCIQESFAPLFEKCGSTKQIFHEKEQSIIRNVEPWLFYFTAIGISIFNRAIKQFNFAKRKHPGGIDIQQAIYLSFCDYFITNDPGQYKMLKVISKLGHRERKIIKFGKLKEMLMNN